jgi:hypothetical protein
MRYSQEAKEISTGKETNRHGTEGKEFCEETYS